MSGNQNNRAAASPNETSQLTTLHENVAAENIASQVSIVHTAEAMQMAVEDFSEHIDHCNVPFK